MGGQAALCAGRSHMARQIAVRAKLNKNGKPSIIRWQGLLCGSERSIRIVTFVSLVILTGSLVFTQFGFVGVGTLGRYSAYCVALLAPIALAGLMLGLWPGTLMGLIAGFLLYLHGCHSSCYLYHGFSCNGNIFAHNIN